MASQDFQVWSGHIRGYVTMWLHSRGWPWDGKGHTQLQINSTVMRLLPDLFRSLDSNGLIPPNFTYELFYKAAYTKYIAAQEKK